MSKRYAKGHGLDDSIILKELVYESKYPRVPRYLNTSGLISLIGSSNPVHKQ